ncbi:hypothetical protein ABPG75_004936 [Micractinium tetrahymenae]
MSRQEWGACWGRMGRLCGSHGTLAALSSGAAVRAVAAEPRLAPPSPRARLPFEPTLWECHVLQSLVCSGQFGSVQAAVAADVGLQHDIVELLVIDVLLWARDGLQAQLVSVNTAEAAGAEHMRRERVALLQLLSWAGSALVASCLDTAACQTLQHPQQWAELLELVGEVLAGLPAVYPAAERSQLYQAAHMQLMMVVNLVVRTVGLQQPPASAAEQAAAGRAAAWGCLRTLPALAANLAALRRDPNAGGWHLLLVLEAMVGCTVDRREWLLAGMTHSCSALDATAVLEAGSTSLQLLPLLGELAADWGPPCGQRARQGAEDAAAAPRFDAETSCSSLATQLLQLWELCTDLGLSWMLSLEPEADSRRAAAQAAAAAAAPAAARLAVTSSRLVHWGAAAPGGAWRQRLQVSYSSVSACDAVVKAAQLSNDLCRMAEHDLLAALPALARHNLAAVAGTWEVVQPCLLSCLPARGVEGIASLRQVACRALWACRQACLLTPQLAATLVDTCSTLLAAEQDEETAQHLMHTVLRSAASQPRLAVVLTTGGVLDAALQRAAALGAPPVELLNAWDECGSLGETAAEPEATARELAQLGQALQELDRGLRRSILRGVPDAEQVLLSLMIPLYGTIVLCGDLADEGIPVPAVLGAAVLVLGSGQTALAGPQRQPAGSQLSPARFRQLLEAQLQVASACVELLASARRRGDDLLLQAGKLFNSADAAHWLAAVADTVLGAGGRGVAREPVELTMAAARSLAHVVHRLLGNDFPRAEAAVASDASLQCSLVQLLLGRALPAGAKRVQAVLAAGSPPAAGEDEEDEDSHRSSLSTGQQRRPSSVAWSQPCGSGCSRRSGGRRCNSWQSSCWLCCRWRTRPPNRRTCTTLPLCS